ncbi:putative bifunctional diguanylate cyclase/phosphodiesterase [Actinoplanes awajinensis]|uniref:Diguanylate cyclase n=1 Tax=Actinoplanes awajinensis subsp. mycoplanecinus TaxID=135947 RepID=A0A101J9N3_9ACTN|nr:EAL domain-containing protein [Actinoplanes awajinensis]KUL22739.1 hypothetical protein ADL15_47620 [Actinoplanes awajinensis subsp. mycoplanecinus]
MTERQWSDHGSGMSASRRPAPQAGEAGTTTIPVVRTLVVDDVDEVRDGLIRLMNRVPGIEVVGGARDGAEAVALTRELRPAVVLMDMRMPGMDGLTATKAITALKDPPAVIVLSAYGDESLVIEALLSGACGYLVKGTSGVALAEAVQAAARGEARLAGSVTRPLVQRLVESLTTERGLRTAAEQAQRSATQRETENRAMATRLAGLLDSAPVGIIETDPTGRVLRWNRAAEDIYGWTEAEVLGRVDPSLADPAVRPESPGSSSAQHLRSDGSTVEVEVAQAPLVDEDEQLTGGIRIVTDVTERRVLEDRLHHQAFHDLLTGLPNRALFLDRAEAALTRARGTGRPVLVFLLDLDGFKTVNDSLGHLAGDELLTIAASRLARCIGEDDTVARLGGDEFAVLVEQFDDPGIAATLATRMLAALQEPTWLAGRPLTIDTSIGVAESCGGDDENALSLLRDADLAMYAAKTSGKARFERFEPRMRVAVMERAIVENDLRAALKLDQLRLVYQPIVDMRTRRMQGAEALLRWYHPERGVIPPVSFIPLAEDLGLMTDLGAWVIRSACRQLGAWRRQLPAGGDLYVSVNLSPTQFADPGLLDHVRDCLTESELEPHSLVLEITEQVLVDQYSRARAVLAELNQIGVRVAIDDFGSGYSSLAYLLELDVDILKIDKSFIDALTLSPKGPVLVGSILHMASALGLRPIAEGIETEEQLDYLLRANCPSGQGFLFSTPVDPEQIAAIALAP